MFTSRRITRVVAGALTVVALAAPVAGARPIDRPAIAQTDHQSPHRTAPSTADEGFDVSSAAIGAGAAAGVLLLSAFGASAISHRHRRVTALR